MAAEQAPVLVLNTGSSSVKLAVFGPDLGLRLSGSADGIGASVARLALGGTSREARFASHSEALAALLEALEGEGVAPGDLVGAGHRVVHGGTALTAPARITPEVRAGIEACVPLAPLHNPHALAAIDALGALAPGLPQCASFDTAFHATNPEVARRYALPSEVEARGIRRYGFHGISYAALVETLPEISGAPLPERLLAFHLGNGASACALLDGRSVATSMGYSPLGGLTMGTRAGEIDGNAVLRLAEEDGIEETRRMLNREAGLAGLSGGVSDMRALLAGESEKSRFAVAHFCYWAVRQGGSLIAAMGGLDAVAFTGGIGENAAPLRARIAEGFAWLGLKLDTAANARGAARLDCKGSTVGAWVVPAREERRIAADALALLAG